MRKHGIGGAGDGVVDLLEEMKSVRIIWSTGNEEQDKEQERQ